MGRSIMRRLSSCVLAALGISCASTVPRAPASVLLGPTADDVSPRLSFCLGKSDHCVMPDFNLSTVNYDLSSKKWQGGVTSSALPYPCFSSGARR